MKRICDLNGTQVEAIIIYHEAFQKQDVPCPTCTFNCCTNCSGAKGYFDSKEAFQEAVAKYGYTDAGLVWKAGDILARQRGEVRQGFFVPGKGCSIPFTERSATCIGFVCSRMNPSQIEAGAKLYRLFSAA